MFAPTSITPTPRGNATVLTVTVPTNAPYSVFNVTVTGNPAPLAPVTLTLTVGAKVAVNPIATASLSKTSGTVTVEVNVTSSPPFAGFIIGVSYNNSVLQFQGIDYSGGALGDDVIVSSECVDGLTSPQCGTPDPRFDAVGVASLDLFTNSGLNTTTPTGKLFSITFRVIGIGFSAIHFVHQEIQIPCANKSQCPPGNNFQDLQSVGYDGYFTNKECGRGNLCKPPVVSFTPPPRPVANRAATFYASARSQNPNGVIREYNWTWRSGVDVHRYNSPTNSSLPPSTNATFQFLYPTETLVTVSAQDNYTARAYYSLSIQVFRVWVDLGFAALNIDHTTGVIPGTIVHIVATAINNGVNPENSTISLSINNKNMTMKSVQNLESGLESSMIYDWNTAGYAPRVYEIVINLDTVKDPTTGRILENDTFTNPRGQIVDPNNVRIAFIQLIVSLPSGFGAFLGLNLPESLGLGIVLVAVIVFAAGLVKKARAQPLEPL